MVADEVAIKLARAHVGANARILDPFCGSGRLLFAAAHYAKVECVGLDVNPLACLLTEAKAARPNIARLEDLRGAAMHRPRLALKNLTLRGTRVDWLSDDVAAELGQIVEWLNREALPREERLVAAACLSAATREAAWIRKSGWKLHRMGHEARAAHRVSPWQRFERKLNFYLREERHSPLSGAVKALNIDAAAFADSAGAKREFDLILTSPPYGDSRTTVQYGAASGICLDVISRLEGLEDRFVTGGAIDRACLGGTKAREIPNFELRKYWSGSTESEPAKRASNFLQDYLSILEACGTLMRPGASAVIIVGRRSLGGHRLRLDDFTRDALVNLQFDLKSSQSRQLKRKSLPKTVNRFGRAGEVSKRLAGATKTMDGEIMLEFIKRR